MNEITEAERESMYAEMRAVNKVYWRIFLTRDNKLVPVEMQWFDEMDYDQSRFIDKVEYDTKEAAQTVIGNILRAFANMVVHSW